MIVTIHGIDVDTMFMQARLLKVKLTTFQSL